MKALGAEQHFRRWDLRILEIELSFLLKELEHLQRKTKERDLNRWEIERLSRIQKEKELLDYRISSGSLSRSDIKEL